MSCHALSVLAMRMELATSQNCRRQTILKLFCPSSKCGVDNWKHSCLTLPWRWCEQGINTQISHFRIKISTLLVRHRQYIITYIRPFNYCYLLIVRFDTRLQARQTCCNITTSHSHSYQCYHMQTDGKREMWKIQKRIHKSRLGSTFHVGPKSISSEGKDTRVNYHVTFIIELKWRNVLSTEGNKR